MEMLKKKLDFDSQVIKQLLKLIPAENLRAYWSIYNSISATEEQAKALPDVNIIDEGKNIFNRIFKIERCGLLPKGTATKVLKVLQEGYSEATTLGLHKAFMNQQRARKKKGPKYHPANDFLIYALVSDCFRLETKHALDSYKQGVELESRARSVFNVIADFMEWHAVEPAKGAVWTEDIVRLQYVRIDPATVLETVFFSHSIKPFNIDMPEHPSGFLSFIAHELGLKEIAQLAVIAYKNHKPISFKKIRKDIKKHLS